MLFPLIEQKSLNQLPEQQAAAIGQAEGWIQKRKQNTDDWSESTFQLENKGNGWCSAQGPNSSRLSDTFTTAGKCDVWVAHAGGGTWCGNVAVEIPCSRLQLKALESQCLSKFTPSLSSSTCQAPPLHISLLYSHMGSGRHFTKGAGRKSWKMSGLQCMSVNVQLTVQNSSVSWETCFLPRSRGLRWWEKQLSVVIVCSFPQFAPSSFYIFPIRCLIYW